MEGRRLALPHPAVTGCCGVKGPGRGWGREEAVVLVEGQKGGMTIWLSSSMYPHMHTPLSDSLPRTQTLAFFSRSFDMGCYCAHASGREG